MPGEPSNGIPPKPPQRIRRLLRSLQRAGTSPAPGPYQHGLPASERQSLIDAAQATKVHPVGGPKRSRAERCAALLRHASIVGACTGGCLGFNTSLLYAALTETVWQFAMVVVIFLVAGTAIGVIVARARLVAERYDLFGTAIEDAGGTTFFSDWGMSHEGDTARDCGSCTGVR